MGEKSPELKALEECLPVLEQFLAGGVVELRWFAGKLQQKSLITKPAAEAAISRHGTIDAERIGALLKPVVAQVMLDEDCFYEFLDIFKSEDALSGCCKKLTKAIEKHKPKDRQEHKPSKADDEATSKPGGEKQARGARPDIKTLREELDEVTDWKGLGLQLSIKYAKLDQIEQDNHRGTQCKDAMLNIWLTNTESASWSHVVEALICIDHKVLASDIKAKYC